MESNHRFLLTMEVCYRYTLWEHMAPGVGIEPTIAESKSVVLPLHYPGSKRFSSAQLSSWEDSLDCLDRASLHYRHSRLWCHTADLNCTRLAGLKPCVYLETWWRTRVSNPCSHDPCKRTPPPSAPPNRGGNGKSRTFTGHRMKVLHYHYATLPF